MKELVNAILTEILNFLSPLDIDDEIFNNEEMLANTINNFIISIGIEEVSAKNETIREFIYNIKKIKSLSFDKSNLPDLIHNLNKLFTLLNSSRLGGDSKGSQELLEKTINFLIVNYLRNYHLDIYRLLTLFNIVGEDKNTHIESIAINKLATLLKKDFIYELLSDDIMDSNQVYLFLEKMQNLLKSIGLFPYFVYPDYSKWSLSQSNLIPDSKYINFDISDQEFRIPIIKENTRDDSNQQFEIGVSILPFSDSKDVAFLISPYGYFNKTNLVKVNRNLEIEFDSNIDSGVEFGLLINSKEVVYKSKKNIEGNRNPKVSMNLSATYTIPDEVDNKKTPAFFSLKYKSLSIGAVVFFGDKFDFLLSIGSNEFVMTLDFSESDVFVKKLLSNDKLTLKFSTAIQLSKSSGISFNGSANLGFTIQSEINIGAVKVQKISFDFSPLASGFQIIFSSDIKVKLGPIDAVINSIGAENVFKLQGFDQPQLFDFQLGFKPPSGVGLSINSSGITGGGFLNFDHNNQRYTGAVGLQFGNIGLSAIGLIVTKSDNYSLLINIGATFSPGVQLGFGFYLSGVGGLIAVNRSMSIKALQEGIRDGAVSNLLFPDITTVVANANQLITQYEGIFPMQDGRYVIGPMIEVGWGPMKMISGRVGIFIEVPTPVRVALLGQVKVRFPSYDEALVVINLDILGVVDFDKSELTFQASLIDSRILGFPISGDSAFLLGWGGSPRFALSMGGFHPKYNPPPPAAIFADMKRLKISLGSGDGLDLSCESYMALTSNSLQFGANVQVKASEGPLEVYGYLGFDGLFIFSPFSFEVEIRGGVDLSYDGTSLCGVHLYLLLSGPTPWYARGRATIEILFFSFDVGFEFTWGDEEKEVLPAKDPLVQLLEELKQPENWGAAQLNRYSLVESFREADPNIPDNPELLLHPASQLELRQRVVPLAPLDDTRITKFGYAPVTGHDWFDISGFIINNTPFGSEAIEDIPDYFAKAQFFDVAKDEQLSLPAFYREKAGIRVSAEGEVLVSASSSKKDVEYEVILLDEYGLHEGTSTQKVEWSKLEGKVAGYADKHQHYRQPPDFRYKSKSLMQPVKRIKRQEEYMIVKKNEKGQWDGPVAMADIHEIYKCLPESLSNRKESTYSKGECLEMLQSVRRSTLKRISNLRIVQA